MRESKDVETIDFDSAQFSRFRLSKGGGGREAGRQEQERTSRIGADGDSPQPLTPYPSNQIPNPKPSTLSLTPDTLNPEP